MLQYMFAINDDYMMQTHCQIMIIERSESKDPRSRNLAGIPIHLRSSKSRTRTAKTLNRQNE